MTTTYYVGPDGQTYSFTLDEQAIYDSLNNLNVLGGASNFDIPISMPSGFGDGLSAGFDIRYQNTVNALSYIGNMSKSETKQDYDRWYGLYKETIENTLAYEINILKKEVERFNADYGTITNEVSKALTGLNTIAQDTKNLLTGFKSMTAIVSGLTALIAFINPIVAVVGVIQILDSAVKKAELPSREKSLIAQAKKVELMIEAYKKNDLYNTLNRFDTKVPKQGAGWNSTNYLILFVAIVFAFLIYRKYA